MWELVSHIRLMTKKYSDPSKITSNEILNDYLNFDKKFNNGKGVKRAQRDFSRFLKNLFS